MGTGTPARTPKHRTGSGEPEPRGMVAARNAGLPPRVSVVVTEDNAHEVDAIVALVQAGASTLTSTPTCTRPSPAPTSPCSSSPPGTCVSDRSAGLQRRRHLLPADPHAKDSICKIGRDDQIDLMPEGIDGLRRNTYCQHADTKEMVQA